ncbi:MAG TPA: GYF domain-containing protein [Myxococcales bacterium]|nr:GYF domain-containing protein [Myxococcales bacterium]
MQFGCESCKAQLQIADEKVRGKRLIVRCRRCGAKIALADPALSNSSPRLVVAPASAPATMRIVPRPTPDPERPATDDESTRAMDSALLERALRASKADDAQQNGAPPTQKLHFPGPVVPLDGPIWYAMLRGKQTGPVTREDLEERANNGELGPRTYLWRDGMDAWQHAKDIPELSDLFPQLPEAVRPGVAPMAAPRSGPAPAPVAQAAPAEPASTKGEATPAATAAPAADPGHPGEAAGGRTEQYGALDVAPRATSEIAQGQEPGSAPDGTQQQMAASVLQRSAPLFESALPPGRGPFVVFLGLICLAAAAIVLWIALASAPSKEEGKAEAQSQRLDPVPASRPARATSGDPVPEESKPAGAPGAGATAVLTAEQVHRKLDENKPALQGCVDDALRRDPHLKVGKIHVATTIAPTGEVTAARIDQRSVDESALGACLKSATRKIVFPQFAGAAFDVDIPIVVTAGE